MIPNVYMLSSGYGGCSYVRIQMPAYNNGFNTDKASLESEKDSPSEVKEAVMAADVVVFHRPELKEYHNLAKMLKEHGKKIVMDNDDTFKLTSHPLTQFTPEAEEVELERRDKSIEDFMKLADLVTTTTKTLANEYKNTNKNTVILPNCIDTMDWDTPLRNEVDIVRIGMVGSVSFEYDYQHLKGVLRKLSKRKDVQLVLFGLGDKKHREDNPNVTEAFKDDYAFWDSVEKEQIPWCKLHEYPEKLNEARLDIMLIPRKDNYFNRCKSNVKFLEAAMCEVPVIAQSFSDGPYEELEDGVTGILVANNHDWTSKIDRLISSKELRRRMGKNAKEYVLKNYNIEDQAYRWADVYSKLYED